jgi:hypothetical protein
MDQQKQEQPQGQARRRMSAAQYRGIFITEKSSGECEFHIGKIQYDCADLTEAIALIDAIYSRVIVKQ